MKTKETLSLIAVMVIALIIYLFVKDKNMNLRITQVENTLNDILNNSDQTKLALAYMIEDQQTSNSEALQIQNREPIGFKQKHHSEA